MDLVVKGFMKQMKVLIPKTSALDLIAFNKVMIKRTIARRLTVDICVEKVPTTVENIPLEEAETTAPSTPNAVLASTEPSTSNAVLVSTDPSTSNAVLASANPSTSSAILTSPPAASSILFGLKPLKIKSILKMPMIIPIGARGRRKSVSGRINYVENADPPASEPTVSSSFLATSTDVVQNENVLNATAAGSNATNPVPSAISTTPADVPTEDAATTAASNDIDGKEA